MDDGSRPTSPVDGAEAPYEDLGKRRVRIGDQSRLEGELSVGDVVRIEGKKTTAVTVRQAPPEDDGQGLARLDQQERTNAGVEIGEEIEAGKVAVLPCSRLILEAASEETELEDWPDGMEALLRRRLSRTPFSSGDVFRLDSTSLLENAMVFRVVEVEPHGVVQVGDGTRFELRR